MSDRWTILRRRDWPNDQGHLVARGAPVPEPDDDLEVIEVAPVHDARAPGPQPQGMAPGVLTPDERQLLVNVLGAECERLQRAGDRAQGDRLWEIRKKLRGRA